MLASSTESCAWVTKQLFVLMLSGHILSVTSSHDKCLGSFLSIYVRSKLVQRGCTNALCTINIVRIYHIYQVSLISSRVSSHQTGQGIQSTETIIHKEIKMMLWELFLLIPMITALCIKITTSNNRHSEHTPQSPVRQSTQLCRQFIVRIMLASNWIVIVRRILLIYLWNLYVTLSFFSNMKTYTGCPQKKFRLLWKTIAPLKIVVP